MIVSIQVVKKVRLKSIRTLTEEAYVKQPALSPQLTQPGQLENEKFRFGRTVRLNKCTVNSGTDEQKHVPDTMPHDASGFPKVRHSLTIKHDDFETNAITEYDQNLNVTDRANEEFSITQELTESGKNIMPTANTKKENIQLGQIQNISQPEGRSFKTFNGSDLDLPTRSSRTSIDQQKQLQKTDCKKNKYDVPTSTTLTYISQTEKTKRVNRLIPQSLLQNLKEIKRILVADLDNWPKLFHNFPYLLSRGIYVWGFHGRKPWCPPDTLWSYKEVIKDGMFQLEFCGKTKDAADGGIIAAVIEMNLLLPEEISIVLVSGDQIFRCKPLQRYMEQSGREFVWVDPHAELKEDRENAKQRIYEKIIGTEVTGGRIINSFVREEEVNRQALIASMKLLYLLCQKEIPYTANIQPLMNVAKDLGVDVITFQKKGDKDKDTSQQHFDYLVNLFGRQIWEELREEIRASPFYSVMVDVTTDISTTLELVIYLRYLKKGNSKTVFGEMINIPDRKADTITAAITDFLRKNDIPMRNMVAFRSDGAAVLVDSKTGVGTKLKEQVPHLLTNHCVAYRLDIAISQAASSIPYLTKFKRIVEQLFLFYAYDGKRMSSPQEIQTLLNEQSLKLNDVKDVKWLSLERAVRAIRSCLPSLLTSLDREACETNDVQAQGLMSYLQTYDFVAALYMVSDILPVLSALSHSFQADDNAYTTVSNLVTNTIATIRALGERPRKHFSSLPAVMAALVTQHFILHTPTDTERKQYEENVYRKFIAAIIENLQERFHDIPLLESFGAFNVQQWPDKDHDLVAYGTDSIQTLASHFRPILSNSEDIPIEYANLKNIVEESAKKAEREKTHGEEEVVNLREVTAHRIMEEVAGPLSTTLPNLARIAAVGLLIPTSTADFERVISTLSRVKTKFRSRLNDSTLNSLLMISIEGPNVSKFNFNKAVSTWVKEKKRRLKV